jgi:hypothetical protein
MPKKQHIQTTQMVYKKKSVEDRFLQKVLKNANDCWIWQASTRKAGSGFIYGQFSFNGYPEWAHRASYLIFKGEIPTGLQVCHKCDVTMCVNPDHLFLGTQRDNMQDMLTKERDAQVGERNHSAILTNENVILARKLSKEGLSHPKIASLFNVSRWTITEAVIGNTWKHITEGL